MDTEGGEPWGAMAKGIGGLGWSSDDTLQQHSRCLYESMEVSRGGSQSLIVRSVLVVVKMSCNAERVTERETLVECSVSVSRGVAD